MKRLILFFAITSFLAGCAHVVSQDLRDQAEEGTPLSMIFSNPDNYKGKVIILGGTIVSSFNKQDRIYIEVLEKPLEHRGILEHTDLSNDTLGSFFILLEGYRNTDMFYRDRRIIVAGEVMGEMVQPAGKVNSTPLLLKSKELHLLNPEEGFIRFGDIWDNYN